MGSVPTGIGRNLDRFLFVAVIPMLNERKKKYWEIVMLNTRSTYTLSKVDYLYVLKSDRNTSRRYASTHPHPDFLHGRKK